MTLQEANIDISGSSLAMCGGQASQVRDGVVCTHVSYGRIVEAMANRFARVVLCVPTVAPGTEVDSKVSMPDYPLPDNVELEPMGGLWASAFAGARHGRKMAEAYERAIRRADYVFVRGCMIGGVPGLYKACRRQSKPVIHWLVGNPIALMKTHRRKNWLVDKAAIAYGHLWEWQLHRGHRKARAAYLCNGQEIADRHPSEHCYVTVSSTLREEDLFEREDTCRSDPVRVLMLSFIRPEKGIEYLLEAFSRLRTDRPVELVLVGSRARYPEYQSRLDAIVERHNMQDRVHWMGHADYTQVPGYMREADVFAFPSLSEGTPRVLVEARGNSLPVVSTNVGGVPSSVTDGVDGLLVPPKDPDAMARAIDRVIADDTLRRSLIRNGFQRAKELTVARFVDRVIQIYGKLSVASGDAAR